MKYPQELLPTANHCLRLNIQAILNTVNLPLVVVRRSSHPFELFGINKNLLAENCVSDDIFNYSMNLLGGGFDDKEHIGLCQKGIGKEPWEGGDVSMNEEEIDASYDIISPAFPIYYLFSEIDEKIVPYEKHFERQKDYQTLYDKLTEQERQTAIGVWSSNNKEVELKGATKVNHAPTNMNYWHVTLDVYAPDNKENPIKKGGGEWKRKITGYMINFLRTHFLHPDKLTEYEIPKYLYYNVV